MENRWCLIFCIVLFAFSGVFHGVAQVPPAAPSVELTIRGTVVGATQEPIRDAAVFLKSGDNPIGIEAKTNARGGFEFVAVRSGNYTLRAVDSNGISAAMPISAVPGAEQKPVVLVLRLQQEAPPRASAGAGFSDQAMQFADKPNFTVAGVTDWSAVGGHGSDSSLRTSEDLARETRALRPANGSRTAAASNKETENEKQLRADLARMPRNFQANHTLGEFYLQAEKYQVAVPLFLAAYEIDPANADNTYELALAYNSSGDSTRAHALVQKLIAKKDTADLHRLAAEIDEKMGDPLAAVQQAEQAVRMDPSEQNYFEWGSELLLHRAVLQAVEVFRNGSKAYPQSARMLAALGTSLFASALYDEAAQRLCDAADLNPADPQPYMFLGKIEMAAPKPLPCVEQKLAGFAQQQPDNAYANYLYATAIWKRQEAEPGGVKDPKATEQAEALLTKAVALNSRCFEAYLQLGIIDASERNYAAAIHSYKKAIEVDPDLSEAHYRLGVAYDRNGEHELARQEFQRHAELETQQAAAVESQRRDVKQFLIVLQGKPVNAAIQ